MSDVLNLEVLARVIDVIVDESDVLRSMIEPHSILHGDLGLDDLDIWGILDDCERTFSIHINFGDVDDWRTVADVVRSVQTSIEGQLA